jgi:aspartate 1-decarboxylase
MTMFCTMLKAKIHRATVTGADIDYMGSITVDRDLLAAAGIREYEKVQVVALGSGARLETYAIEGPSGSGTIQLNGAAARLIGKGDKVIIMSYSLVPEPPPLNWSPAVVWVDEQNRIERTSRDPLH